jgi:hypothetical protein
MMSGVMSSPVRIALVALVAVSICGCMSFGYQAVEGKCVFRHYPQFRREDTQLAGCDPDSFEELSDFYARDANHVWHTWTPIAEADPGSFEVLSSARGWSYARDAHHVYLEELRVCGADPATFRLLETPYARDATRVFCGNIPLEVSEPARFEMLESGVRYGGPVRPEDLPGLLTSEAEACVRNEPPHRRHWTDDGWARDGRNYYRGCFPMRGIDYRTFEILPGGDYSKDRNTVYWFRHEVQGADAPSFEMVDPHECRYAKDVRAVYTAGREVRGADPATFEVAGPWTLSGIRPCKPRDATRSYGPAAGYLPD